MSFQGTPTRNLEYDGLLNVRFPHPWYPRNESSVMRDLWGQEYMLPGPHMSLVNVNPGSGAIQFPPPPQTSGMVIRTPQYNDVNVPFTPRPVNFIVRDPPLRPLGGSNNHVYSNTGAYSVPVSVSGHSYYAPPPVQYHSMPEHNQRYSMHPPNYFHSVPPPNHPYNGSFGVSGVYYSAPMHPSNQYNIDGSCGTTGTYAAHVPPPNTNNGNNNECQGNGNAETFEAHVSPSNHCNNDDDDGIDGVPEQMNGHHHMPMQNFHNVNVPNNNEENGIRDVWADNLYDEFRVIRSLLHRYSHVAMDTEFPGVVARPIGEFRNSSEYQYQLLRVNVDMLNIIQIGLTFMDEHGNTPPGISTWQFNFKFNLAEEMYAQDSIELLTNSGIQFKKHETDGIDWRLFSEFFITSGYLLNDNVKWLSFHSGYDFGYLLKILINKKLPKDESGFFDLLKIYFPHIYDVKYLMKSCKNLKGGLQEVADQLEIERIGLQHQAGSDSLLTGMAFFRMKEMFFEDNIDEAKYSGHLYGFGTSFAQSNDLTVYYVQQQSDHTTNNSY